MKAKSKAKDNSSSRSAHSTGSRFPSIFGSLTSRCRKGPPKELVITHDPEEQDDVVPSETEEGQARIFYQDEVLHDPDAKARTSLVDGPTVIR